MTKTSCSSKSTGVLCKTEATTAFSKRPCYLTQSSNFWGRPDWYWCSHVSFPIAMFVSYPQLPKFVFTFQHNPSLRLRLWCKRRPNASNRPSIRHLPPPALDRSHRLASIVQLPHGFLCTRWLDLFKNPNYTLHYSTHFWIDIWPHFCSF